MPIPFNTPPTIAESIMSSTPIYLYTSPVTPNKVENMVIFIILYITNSLFSLNAAKTNKGMFIANTIRPILKLVR